MLNKVFASLTMSHYGINTWLTYHTFSGHVNSYVWTCAQGKSSCVVSGYILCIVIQWFFWNMKKAESTMKKMIWQVNGSKTYIGGKNSGGKIN